MDIELTISNNFFFFFLGTQKIYKTTNRAESFMDLSLDIEQNSSVTSCLRQFSASEMLCHKDKFYCDECCGLQEAEKRYIVVFYYMQILGLLYLRKIRHITPRYT